VKKRLVGGYFSSVPLAQLLTATADIAPEDEVRDDSPAGNENYENYED
jgi:hypothetical protein